MGGMADKDSRFTLILAGLLVGGASSLFSAMAMVNNIFMIPSFFIFLRLAILARTVVSSFARFAPNSSGSLAAGAAIGAGIIVTVGVLGVLGARLLRSYAVETSDAAAAGFDAGWQIFGALTYAYLAVCLVRLPELPDLLHARAIEKVRDVENEAAGDAGTRRSGYFHAAMTAVLRDLWTTALFLLTFGGWGRLVAVPVPAVVGVVIGLLFGGVVAGSIAADLLDSGDVSGASVAAGGGDGGGFTRADSVASAYGVDVAATGPRRRKGAVSSAVTNAAVRAGGVISEREEARVISSVWEERRVQIIGELPPERRWTVAHMASGLHLGESARSIHASLHQDSQGAMMTPPPPPQRRSISGGSVGFNNGVGRAPVSGEHTMAAAGPPLPEDEPVSAFHGDDYDCYGVGGGGDHGAAEEGASLETVEDILAGARARAAAAAVPTPAPPTTVAPKPPGLLRVPSRAKLMPAPEPEAPLTPTRA
ncbi:unnamed protein product, partial [Phaeothamnion confervicola]